MTVMNKKTSLAQELENLTSTVMSSVKMMNISDYEFESIRSIVYQKFGINLTDEKRGLVVGRLQKVVKDLGLNSFSEYCAYVNSDKTGNALDQLVNKISTNLASGFPEVGAEDVSILIVMSFALTLGLFFFISSSSILRTFLKLRSLCGKGISIFASLKALSIAK